jgi:hypothetical protein
MTLLDKALKACGGLEHWNRFDRFEVHLSIGGSYLASKVDATMLKEIVVSGDTRSQSAEVVGMLDSSRRGLCRANWVGIENYSGTISAQQSVTPETFAKLGSMARWTELDVVYYCGISIWNFVNCPFFLAEGGFKIGEMAPLNTDGEEWRRLHVMVPDRIATEAREQILYFDSRNRHRRTDYLRSDLTANSIAHLLSAHQDFSKIVIPTLRRSRFIDADRSISQESIPFDIEIFDLVFSRDTV